MESHSVDESPHPFDTTQDGAESESFDKQEPSNTSTENTEESEYDRKMRVAKMIFIYQHLVENDITQDTGVETETNSKDIYDTLSTELEYGMYEDPIESYNFLTEIANENGCTAKCYYHELFENDNTLECECRLPHTEYKLSDKFDRNETTLLETYNTDTNESEFHTESAQQCNIHVHDLNETEPESGRASQHEDTHYFRQYTTNLPNYDHIYYHGLNNLVTGSNANEIQKDILENDEYVDIMQSIDAETYMYKHDVEYSQDTVRSMYLTGTQSGTVYVNDIAYQKLKYGKYNEISGTIGNKYKVTILVDNGATYSILSTKAYKNMPQLKYIPKIPLAGDLTINTGNGSIKCHFWIEIPVKIQEVELQLRLLVCDTQATADILLGKNTLQELSAWQDYTNNVIYLAQISVPFIATNTKVIKPGALETITMRLRFDNCSYQTSKDFCGQGIGYVKTHTHPLMPYIATELTIVNNKSQVKIRNKTSKDIIINENDTVAFLDCRSKGKFLTLQPENERFEDVYNIMFNQHETKHKTLSPEPIASEQFMRPCEAPRLAKRGTTATDDTNKATKEDKLPWLEKDDPRRKMTDKEILYNKIKLDDSILKEQNKRDELIGILEDYKQAFSLRDEIGTCPYVEVHLKLRDDTPFFVRPYAIREEHKKVIDKEMKRLEYLGIIKKGLTGYSSPVLLVKRKQQNLYRVCTDFRVLNDRLVRINHAFPLVRDCIESIGSANCEVMSTIDLRDAFHTLRLAEDSQQYCGITPFYGSPTYYYLRMGMGMSVSPQIWQQFVDLCFNDDVIKHPERYKIIMDDAMLFSTIQDHYDGLIDMFKVLIKYGLKISPHKCQLFRDQLIYMGLHFMIKDGRACYTPMKDKCAAIRGLKPPRTVKECRSFCGMVNFLSTFLKDLRRKLIPIYELQKKKRKYKWNPEADQAFEEIKELLVSPPILRMPTSDGLFRLESDTSREGVGGTLFQWQIANGKGGWVIVGYHSKRLPKAVQNYGVTELELTGLIVNIHGFSQLLKHRYFEVLVDHKAIEHLKKGRTEPPTNRLTTLLLKLRDYQIDLKYQVGSQMHTSDALSRLFNANDSKDLDDVIPLNFLIHLSDKHIIHAYQHLATNIFAHKKSTVTTPKRPRGRPRKNPVQGTVKQKSAKQRTVKQKKSEIITDSDKSILEPRQINSSKVVKTSPNDALNQTMSLVRYGTINSSTQPQQLQLDEVINEPAVVNTIRQPDKEFFQISKPILPENTSLSVLRRHIPKQIEIDKMLANIRSKVLRNLNVPIQLKDLAQAYKKSSRFQHIYNYIADGKLPSKIQSQKTIRAEALNYMVINDLLFRIDLRRTIDDEGNQLLLVIPEDYESQIFNTYHNSLLASHQGPWKTFLTLRKKFFMHNMLNKLKKFIEACHVCLKTKAKSTINKPQYGRIPTDYSPMSSLSADIKYMPDGFANYRFLLVTTCEHTNFTMAIPLQERNAQAIAEALIHRVISIFGPPKLLIVDQDKAFTSKVIVGILQALQCDMKLISPFNHGSSKTERQIQTIGKMISKHLWDKGQMWPLFAGVSAFAMNTFASEALNGLSPFELVFARKPPDLSNLTMGPIEDIPVDHKEYYRLLQTRAEFIKQMHLAWKTEQASQYEQTNKMFKNEEQYTPGQLVYLLAPHASSLQSGTTKFRQDFIGPLVIDTVFDKTHYQLKDLSNRVLPEIYHVNRIKGGPVNTPSGIARTHDEFLKAAHTEVRQLKEIEFKSLPQIAENQDA